MSKKHKLEQLTIAAKKAVLNLSDYLMVSKIQDSNIMMVLAVFRASRDVTIQFTDSLDGIDRTKLNDGVLPGAITSLLPTVVIKVGDILLNPETGQTFTVGAVGFDSFDSVQARPTKRE